MRTTLAGEAPAPAHIAAPIIQVEGLTRVIATRAQRTVILDDVTLQRPGAEPLRHQWPIGQRQIDAAQPAHRH